MKTIDFAKQLKDLYTARRTPQEVRADRGVFLAAAGRGAPGGPEFQQLIRGLYSVAYTLKFACKKSRTVDFKVSRLECLYYSDPNKVPFDEWEWKVLIRIPEEVTAAEVTETKKLLRQKGNPDAAAVKRIAWREGRALQVLHVGPYEQLHQTYVALCEFAQEHGLTPRCPGHEIYLSDPHRTAPAKLKTIVRMGVTG